MPSLRIALKDDMQSIARLHCQNIEAGFLSSLGQPFLNLLYEAMAVSRSAVCFVAEENGQIIGFASGAVSVGGFYKEFLKKQFLRAMLILLPRAIKPAVAKKIVETLFYPSKNEGKLPSAELLSIVVDQNLQGQRIGEKLFIKLVGAFRERGITQFKVIVGENLTSACKFYEKMGGAFHSEIEVHRDEKSRVYIWTI